MNARIKLLRDLVVALDRADRKFEPMSPEAYRIAAAKAQVLTREEMGLLPMGDFAGPCNSLQTFAENLFFGMHGCFADLDASGSASVARRAGRAFISRLCTSSAGEVAAVSDGLFARLRMPTLPAAAPRRAGLRKRRAAVAIKAR